MALADELLVAWAPREERVKFRGKVVVMRELDAAADVAALRGGDDNDWKMVVRSCFDADGVPVFTDAHIPALKRLAFETRKTLVEAALRVNAAILEQEVKPSAETPAGG